MGCNIGTGSRSYVRYAYEGVYNTAEADGNLSKYFGHNVKFTASPKNNLERIPNLNSRNYSKYVAKKFEGSFTVDFQMSNAYFLKGVIGAVTSTGGVGAYQHSYAESNCPSGATIQSSEDLDTDSERTFTGCIFDKLTLNMAVGEVVTGKIDGFYSSESKDATLNTTGNDADADDVFTFAHATLEFPNSTTITEVQSLDLNISNNTEMVWGLGSSKSTKRASKQRVYEFSINKIRTKDADLLDKFYGSTTTISDTGTPTSGATLKVTLDNGISGASNRAVVFEFDNIQVVDPSIPLEPTEIVKESATLYALSIGSASGVLVYNNTATQT